MLTAFFNGVGYAPSSFSGFYQLSYRGKSYFACEYRDRNRGKSEINELMKTQITVPNYRATEFDFHHLVERPHLADISISGPTVDESYPSMPTVMIHKNEHHRYKMMLRAGETRELYMRLKDDLPTKVSDREKAVRSMLAGENIEEATRELIKRIDIMKSIYLHVYERNELLRVIASNIFKHYKSRLIEI